MISNDIKRIVNTNLRSLWFHLRLIYLYLRSEICVPALKDEFKKNVYILCIII